MVNEFTVFTVYYILQPEGSKQMYEVCLVNSTYKYLAKITPLKLLRGKFLREEIEVFHFDSAYIKYRNICDAADKTNISLVIPLRDDYPLTIEVENGEDGIGYPFEIPSLSKSNIQSEARKAYKFFLESH